MLATKIKYNSRNYSGQFGHWVRSPALISTSLRRWCWDQNMALESHFVSTVAKLTNVWCIINRLLLPVSVKGLQPEGPRKCHVIEEFTRVTGSLQRCLVWLSTKYSQLVTIIQPISNHKLGTLLVRQDNNWAGPIDFSPHRQEGEIFGQFVWPR